MIIIRISGGIGNQMFQYALGRALSLRNSGAETALGELKLDTSFYSLGIEPDRSFKLPHFNIPGIADMIARPADFKKIGIPDPARRGIFSRLYRGLYRRSESRTPLALRKIVSEPGFDFHPGIMDLHGDHYVAGVWQSERYFMDYAAEIKKDLTLVAPFSVAAMDMARQIREAGDGSISVHIRRGDKVSNPWLLTKYGALGKEYYLPAIEYISGKVSSPHLFVFSDDIAWCEGNLRFDLPTTYVSAAGIPDYEELILMSMCAHAIAAKSSFSWWAAWLNRNPNKIVVVPSHCFGDATVRSADHFPESWVRI